MKNHTSFNQDKIIQQRDQERYRIHNREPSEHSVQENNGS